MTSSLVVLRTSVLLMLLLVLIAALYAAHVTRLSADAATQAAAGAAAQAAVAADWQCLASPPSGAASAAASAAMGQLQHLAVQPVAVEVRAEACNLITAVTVAPLGTQIAALQTIATACRSATGAAVLSVPASC